MISFEKLDENRYNIILEDDPKNRTVGRIVLLYGDGWNFKVNDDDSHYFTPKEMKQIAKFMKALAKA